VEDPSAGRLAQHSGAIFPTAGLLFRKSLDLAGAAARLSASLVRRFRSALSAWNGVAVSADQVALFMGILPFLPASGGGARWALRVRPTGRPNRRRCATTREGGSPEPKVSGLGCEPPARPNSQDEEDQRRLGALRRGARARRHVTPIVQPAVRLSSLGISGVGRGKWRVGFRIFARSPRAVIAVDCNRHRLTYSCLGRH